MKTRKLVTTWEEVLIEKSRTGKPLEITQAIANNKFVTFLCCDGEIVVDDENLTRITIMPFDTRQEAYDKVVTKLEGKVTK